MCFVQIRIKVIYRMAQWCYYQTSILADFIIREALKELLPYI